MIPIVSALLGSHVYPLILIAFPPGLLVAVIWRTVHVPGNKFKVFGASFGIAVLSWIFLRVVFLDIWRVVGDGMFPTLANGSVVTSLKAWRGLVNDRPS